MTSQTNEKAFEATVESMLVAGGWQKGDPAEWDATHALFRQRVLDYIQANQPQEWAYLATQLGARLAARVIEGLEQELADKGTLHILRHGFKFYGKTLRVAQFKPAHGLNPKMLEKFARNELTVTRQVPCHPDKHDTVDMVFALNGVPVATCELKNPMTGQSWRDAVRQYKTSRDPNAPIFLFRQRALVHFAVDTEEVHMTTRLEGTLTRFLPFNRGSKPGDIGCGKGNPSHPSGYRTGYFWQEVLERESFLEILGSYMFVAEHEEKTYEGTEAVTVKHEALVFPRYHQLDCVRNLLVAAKQEGAGHNYLVQHSAGSGKTNSISWLSHRLASLHTEDDKKVFDCVLVITDRRVLDRQLQDAIYQIEHAHGVAKAIDQDSGQLAQALIDGTKIVITTLQKFPFVLQRLLGGSIGTSDNAQAETDASQAEQWRTKIASRRYAVIVDEAHSSQTGENARELKALLGARSISEADAAQDWEDGLNAVMASRLAQSNLSFFAFTATPKAKTIELFGRKGATTASEPFHVYSMRQAIEEQFILDVLCNYTDYKTYYRLLHEAETDPEFPKQRGVAALTKFTTLHCHNLSQKTEVIVEHFRTHVLPCMGGKAKAMVVASSRLHAVRYMQAFQLYIQQRGYHDVRPLVAFSGSVEDPATGKSYTEPAMNIDIVTGKPIGEMALAARFDSPDYQILLVAEKYQTGFDQPLLQAMYIDKPLSGVHAVQTLSRLNRVALGKKSPFVLDFVNTPDTIQQAFAPYYDQTRIDRQTDHRQLYQLHHELDQTQVYHHEEIEAFAQIFYLPVQGQRSDDHPRLAAQLQPAVGRFGALDDDKQTLFRDTLSKFVSLYAFLSQIIPYGDSDFEKLYAFGRMLLPCLRPGSEPLRLDEYVDLEYYRLEHVSSSSIGLDDEANAAISTFAASGAVTFIDEQAPLAAIIAEVNGRFGTDFKEADRLFLQQVQQDALSHPDIYEIAKANSFEKFKIGVREQMPQMMIARMAGNDAFVRRVMNDPALKEWIVSGLLREVYDTASAQP